MPGKNEVNIEVFKTVSDFLSLFLLFFKRPLITVNDPNKKNENKVSHVHSSWLHPFLGSCCRVEGRESGAGNKLLLLAG